MQKSLVFDDNPTKIHMQSERRWSWQGGHAQQQKLCSGSAAELHNHFCANYVLPKVLLQCSEWVQCPRDTCECHQRGQGWSRVGNPTLASYWLENLILSSRANHLWKWNEWWSGDKMHQALEWNQRPVPEIMQVWVVAVEFWQWVWSQKGWALWELWTWW